MITVHKFPLKIEAWQEIQMPFGAELLHVGLDPKLSPCVWAKVEDVNSHAPVFVSVIGTGHMLPFDDAKHIGSFVDGSFVWHAWRVLS